MGWGSLQHVGSSRIKTRNCVFCSGKHILIHCGGGGGGGLVAKSFPTLATPWTIACQAPLSMGFSRQEYWSGLPFPPPAYSLYHQGSPGLFYKAESFRKFSALINSFRQVVMNFAIVSLNLYFWTLNAFLEYNVISNFYPACFHPLV